MQLVILIDYLLQLYHMKELYPTSKEVKEHDLFYEGGIGAFVKYLDRNKVALLPDSAFFTRSVAVTAGATPEEAAGQIELALEGLAPFPLSQLYYGWFWRPGSEQALLFAAYRRRFTAEQVAEWGGAELVIPAFAAVLGSAVEPATTVLLTSSDSITAVHWTAAGEPAGVVKRTIDAEATDEDRARTKSELVASFGGSRHVIEPTAASVPDPAGTDGAVTFRAGELVSKLPATAAAAADVRDKAELTALRAARRRRRRATSRRGRWRRRGGHLCRRALPRLSALRRATGVEE